jgi:ribosome recycling factor
MSSATMRTHGYIQKLDQTAKVKEKEIMELK